MIIGSKIVRVVPDSTKDLADCNFKAAFEFELVCPITKRRTSLFAVAILPHDDRDAVESVELILRASGCDESLAAGIVRQIDRSGPDEGIVEVERN